MPNATRRTVVKAASTKSSRPSTAKGRGASTREERVAVPATARLEARVPSELYEIMKRAAEMRGVSLTSYIIDSVGEQARKDIEQIAIIRLALPDQIRFAEALLNPPAANKRLKNAFALRRSLITAP